MEGNDISYIFGTAGKYSGLVGGITSSLTLESPQNYFLSGICLFIYLGGEIMQKTSKDKNLEDKLKK